MMDFRKDDGLTGMSSTLEYVLDRERPDFCLRWRLLEGDLEVEAEASSTAVFSLVPLDDVVLLF